MKRFVVAVVVVATAAVLGLIAKPSAARADSFDGVWSVLIATAQGNCGSYRAAVQISGGQVSSAEGDYAISGTVTGSGATAVTVISNQGSASGTGRLHGTSGSGRWRSSSGECSGAWTAARRQ